MAVFTEVEFGEADALVQRLGLGPLRELRGIEGGIENTNYFATTESGEYVLTLFERLSAELARSLQLPDVQARIKALGGEPGNLIGEPFAAMNRQEFEHYGQLVRAANIKAE
ncbi:phosphotransferase [Variovorax sp. CT11-76]|eukprot:gene27845-31459_t